MFMERRNMNDPVNRKTPQLLGMFLFSSAFGPRTQHSGIQICGKGLMCCGFENSNTTNDGNQLQRENLLQSDFSLEFPKPPAQLVFPSTPTCLNIMGLIIYTEASRQILVHFHE